MSSYHTIIIVGRLGRDPEMRYSPSGDAVTSFSVATDRQYTDASGKKAKETIWFRASVWGKQAESCSTYLKKGSQVLVEGRLTCDAATGGPRIYESKGEKRTSFEIAASTVRFLTSNNTEKASGEETHATEEDEVPF